MADLDHDYSVLDLFAGLGGFSQAFAESDRWRVTTVEIDERFDPDIQADVFELRPSDFDREFDVVLASPPCTEFSPAQNLNDDHDPNGDAVALVYHALGLIRGLDPDWWVLENPRGRLRSIIGAPETTVTYCQYGKKHMKPTDLWGHHPPSFAGRRCDYGDDCHDGGRNGTNDYPDDPNEKAKVPFQLSEDLRLACERASENRSRQQTLTESL